MGDRITTSVTVKQLCSAVFTVKGIIWEKVAFLSYFSPYTQLTASC